MESKKIDIKREILNSIKDLGQQYYGKVNLEEVKKITNYLKYEPHSFQIDLMKLSISFFERYFLEQQIKKMEELNLNTPLHLLFNMATGSGKTYVMAFQILLLFKEYGYKDVLFLSHSNIISNKAKGNFINENSDQYLFNNLKGIKIKKRELFEEITDEEEVINITIETYQKFMLDDGDIENYFHGRKLLILCDEAHHLNEIVIYGVTRTWGEKIAIFSKLNDKNITLYFTGTPNISTERNIKLYNERLFFKYGLREFYESKLSKIPYRYRLGDRHSDNVKILIVCTLNEYIMNIGEKMNLINFKPIALVRHKSKKAIREVKNDFAVFLQNITSEIFIQSLEMIVDVNDNSGNVITEAYKWAISNPEVIKNRIQDNFSGNSTHLTTDNQIMDNKLINLDNQNNPIRLIFDCRRLTEGWDAKNLYQILMLNKKVEDEVSSQDVQAMGRALRYPAICYKEGAYEIKRHLQDHPEGKYLEHCQIFRLDSRGCDFHRQKHKIDDEYGTDEIDDFFKRENIDIKELNTRRYEEDEERFRRIKKHRGMFMINPDFEVDKPIFSPIVIPHILLYYDKDILKDEGNNGNKDKYKYEDNHQAEPFEKRANEYYLSVGRNQNIGYKVSSSQELTIIVLGTWKDKINGEQVYIGYYKDAEQKKVYAVKVLINDSYYLENSRPEYERIDTTNKIIIMHGHWYYYFDIKNTNEYQLPTLSSYNRKVLNAVKAEQRVSKKLESVLLDIIESHFENAESFGLQYDEFFMDEIRKECVRFRDLGISLEEAGREFGMNEKTMRIWLRDDFVSRTGDRYSQEEWENIVREINEQIILKKIGEGDQESDWHKIKNIADDIVDLINIGISKGVNFNKESIEEMKIELEKVKLHEELLDYDDEDYEDDDDEDDDYDDDDYDDDDYEEDGDDEE